MFQLKMNLFKVITVDIGASMNRTIDPQTNQLFISNNTTDVAGSTECFSQGVVIKPSQLKRILSSLLEPIWRPKLLLQPTLISAVFTQSSKIEREILSDTLYQLGARKVVLFPTPLAAILGRGVSLSDTSGDLILHLGQSVTEVSLISLGSLVANEVTFFAGAHLDRQIKTLGRQKYQLSLSDDALKLVKQQLLSFNSTNKSIMVKGKNIVSGQIDKKRLFAHDFQPLLIGLADRYTALVKMVLKRAPVGLVVSALEKGMILSGGLANITGLADYLTQQLAFPVLLTEKSELNVIYGLNKLGRDLSIWQQLAFTD